MAGGVFSLAKGGTVEKIDKYARKGQQAIADLIGQGEEIKYANELSRQQFPNEEEDGRGDALRHLLWQGAVQQGQGTVPAVLSGYGHELGLNMSDPATEMDLANNALGRQLGEETKTREELLERAMDAINTGKAKTLGKKRK